MPPPHSSSAVYGPGTTLEQLWLRRANIVMLGDFNSDLNFRGKTQAEKYLGKRLLEVLNPLNMENVITESTRITKKSSTTIDLIVSSDKSRVNIITPGQYYYTYPFPKGYYIPHFTMRIMMQYAITPLDEKLCLPLYYLVGSIEMPHPTILI